MSQVLHAPSRSSRGPDAEVSRLYAEYGDKLFRFCLGQLRSREEAEDAVQNTFLRVCTALRKGVVPEFEGPWLYKIAHNVCLSRRLGSSRRSRVETPADLDTLGERAAAHTPDADELFGLDDALADMPPNLRQPLLMREWQGMSYAEISEALGVSHSAVETLIFRARRHLAQALTDSVKKSGRAVASIFNIRWLYGFFKGLGGGAGGMGMAAGAAGLVVAIGGGVAVDLATQHASAASRRVTTAAATAPVQLAARTGSAPSGANSRIDATRGARSVGGAGSTGRAGSAPGAPGVTRSGLSSGTVSTAAGTTGVAAEASGSPASAPSPTPRNQPSGSAGQSSSKRGPGASTPPGGQGGAPTPQPQPQPTPPAPDPGGILPPVAVPSVPPVAPPSVSPPGVPPLPPLPPAPPVVVPPVLSTPENLVAEATGPLGAAVAYSVTAKDSSGASLAVSCAPASGSTFALGHTSVSCSAADKQGNTSRASFDVQVRDTTPPALTVPTDITVNTVLANGLKVTYSATATDRVDSSPRVSCSPPSGSLFLVQTTTVTCTAADASGNATSKSFHVTVTLVPPAP